jgi:hypothetical protein
MKRLWALGLLAVSACAPNFGAPCADDADCGADYFCSEDGRCLPGVGEGEGEDAGVPDAGPVGPTVFVGPGEICDDVTIGCEDDRDCVFLGERPGYSVCEPLTAEGGCPAGQVSIVFCTANTDEEAPHTVECPRHCVEAPGGRSGGEGDACTTDEDCALRTCAYDDTGATVCRSNRLITQGARPADEDGSFTPACAPPMEGAEEVGRGVISCRWPCRVNSDCPTEQFFSNLCVQAEGLCDQPGCNFSDCVSFGGSDCRFGNTCRSDNYDMPGQSCFGDESCVDDRPCWSNDEASICEPPPLLPGGACAAGYSEATICDGPCRQACVFTEVCDSNPGLCETSRAGIGDAVADPLECAFPLDAIDLGGLQICAEGCVPTSGRTGFTCGETDLNGEKPESCEFAGDGYCPQPGCDTCAGGEICASTPAERLFINTDPAMLEFCLADGSCRLDADCPQVCSSTTRTCATIDAACAGTALSGLQPANWLRDVDEGKSAQAVAVNGKVYRYGGSYLSDPTTDYLYMLHADGSGWSWILIPDALGDPPDTESAAVAADEANARVVVYGGRDVDGNFVNELWTFDTNLYEWTQHTPLAGTAPERADHTAAVVGDELILIGGVDSVGPTDVVARFNFSTRTWSTEAASGVAVADHAMSVRDDGTFLVAGAGTSVHTYDPASSTWTERATGAALLNRLDAAMVRDTNAATEQYLVCGGTVSDVAEASCVRIDEAFVVTAADDLPTAITSPSAAVHPGTGRAFIEGDEGAFVLVPEDLCLP